MMIPSDEIARLLARFTRARSQRVRALRQNRNDAPHPESIAAIPEVRKVEVAVRTAHIPSADDPRTAAYHPGAFALRVILLWMGIRLGPSAQTPLPDIARHMEKAIGLLLCLPRVAGYVAALAEFVEVTQVVGWFFITPGPDAGRFGIFLIPPLPSGSVSPPRAAFSHSASVGRR